MEFSFETFKCRGGKQLGGREHPPRFSDHKKREFCLRNLESELTAILSWVLRDSWPSPNRKKRQSKGRGGRWSQSPELLLLKRQQIPPHHEKTKSSPHP